MCIKQLSVFVENKQGALSEILSILSENNINMRAISIADTQDFGVLRMIVNDVKKAKDVLHQQNVLVNITEVIGVEIPDTVGALSEIVSFLKEGGVNIEYTYAFVTPGKTGSAYMVLRPTSNEKAQKVLSSHGINTLTEEELQLL